MNLNIRRIIYLSFFAVFLTAAAGLLFYVQGYRYNPVKGKVVRTGAIVVDSNPAGARITLNGAVQADQTPTSLQSLQPADYDVGVELAGFQPWHKTLAVKPSLVTFTGDIHLWPETTNGTKLLGSPIGTTALSPTGEHLLSYVPSGLNSGLWLYNLSSGQGSLLTRLGAGTITTLEWHPSGLELLLGVTTGTTTRYQTFSLTSRVWETVSWNEDITPEVVHWGDDESSLLVYADQALYQYSRRLSSLRLLWRADLIDFRAHDGMVFGLVRQGSAGPELRLLNLSSLKNVPLEDVPILSTSLKFLEARNAWLPLYDQDRHSLYLLHSPLTEPVPVRKLPEVTTIDWSPDGLRLLLTNNFELWQYDVTADTLTLALRVSTPLTQSRLVGREPYAVVASGSEVWAMEFDSRGLPQRWRLADYGKEQVQDLFLDPRGENLTVRLLSGLWRLNLGTPLRER
jgi:hypothetical protein